MDSLKGCRWIRATQAELTASILERAVAEVNRTGPKTGVMIGPYAARDETLRDGLETTYRTLAGTETDECPALCAGRQGERRAKVDPAMTEPTPAGLALRCPNCGAVVSADQAFCEECGTSLQPTVARRSTEPAAALETPVELTGPSAARPTEDRADRSRSPGPATTAAAWSGPTATARPAG